MAGSISSITVKPGVGQTAQMTAKVAIHEFAEPWCVYTMPKAVSMPPERETLAEGSAATTTLDMSASFGSCASSRVVEVSMLITNSEGLPLLAEVTG